MRLLIPIVLTLSLNVLGQPQTITIDAKANALLLTSKNAKMVGNLTANQRYTVSVTANNISGSPMQGVFFVAEDSSEVQCRYVPSGASFQYVPINSSYQLAAFYVDWSSTSDNSGTVTVNINGPTTQTLTINAKDNAIFLDTISTVIGNLNPTQEYVVAVRDSALSGILTRGVFFMYEEAAGDVQFKYIPSGQAFTFKPNASSYQLAPLYVDWSTTSDNTGKIFVDISTIMGTTKVEGSRVNVTDFDLSQNYPNPFNPSTTIRYTIPTRSAVRVQIYNLLGQLIATLVNEEKSAGEYQVLWQGDQYPSGVYFCRLNVVDHNGNHGEFSEMTKMLLIK